MKAVYFIRPINDVSLYSSSNKGNYQMSLLIFITSELLPTSASEKKNRQTFMYNKGKSGY
jgi:hypothetical protein